jgi:hypothetical protein
MKIIILFICIIIFIIIGFFKIRSNFNQQIKILVISLPGSKRREEITKKINNVDLKFEFIDGVKVSNIEELQPIFIDFDLQDINPIPAKNIEWGTVGCGLAYLRVVKYIIDNNIDHCLILEDDVSFIDSGIKNFKKNPEKYMNQCSWLMVHKQIITHNFGTTGQIVNINGAKKIWSNRKKLIEALMDNTGIDTAIIETEKFNIVDYCKPNSDDLYIVEAFADSTINNPINSERSEINKNSN